MEEIIRKKLREGMNIDDIFNHLRGLGYEWHEIEKAFLEGDFSRNKNRADILNELVHVGLVMSSFILAFRSRFFLIVAVVMIIYFLLIHLERAHNSNFYVGSGFTAFLRKENHFLLNPLYVFLLTASVLTIYGSIVYGQEDTTIMLIMLTIGYIFS